MPPCHCQSSSYSSPAVTPRTVLRSVMAVGLSFLVAFFPKCPMCWAAYMSALGIAGLAQIPYMSFVFPVLVGMLGLHLFLLGRQMIRVRPGPFLASVVGTLIVLL